MEYACDRLVIRFKLLVTKNGSVSKWSNHKLDVLERWSDNLWFSIL